MPASLVISTNLTLGIVPGLISFGATGAWAIGTTVFGAAGVHPEEANGNNDPTTRAAERPIRFSLILRSPWRWLGAGACRVRPWPPADRSPGRRVDAVNG